MKNYDMFKFGFWSTIGRSTAKVVFVCLAGKIIFEVSKKSVKKNGGKVIDAFIAALSESMEKNTSNLSAEEVSQLTSILNKINKKEETTEEPEEESEEK